MREPRTDGASPTRVDFEFRRRVAQRIAGNLASYCYQCGACVGDCPAAAYSDSGFNPREIVLKVLYGFSEELLVENSILWECTSCYNCHERCPQQVKPVEVIISLKNLMAEAGICPEPVGSIVKVFLKTGRTVAPSAAIDRQRKRFGLAPLPAVPIDEIRAIIQPSSDGEGKE